MWFYYFNMVSLLLLIYYDFISFMDLLNNNTRKRIDGETIIARVVNLITVIQKKCANKLSLCVIKLYKH